MFGGCSFSLDLNEYDLDIENTHRTLREQHRLASTYINFEMVDEPRHLGSTLLEMQIILLHAFI